MQVQKKKEIVNEFIEKVVYVSRVARVVKGGRRFSFNALIVIGNKKGKIGVGLGKAKEAPASIRDELRAGLNAITGR